MLDPSQSVSWLKSQLYSLTGVEPEQQKLMMKGSLLKNDADLSNINIVDGQLLMMMGTSLASAAASSSPGARDACGMAPGSEKQPATASPVQPVIMVPCGLENLGNTCYLNASLQCMTAAIPEMKRALMSFYHASKDEPGLGQKKFVASIGATLEEMKEASSVSPFLLVQLLRLLYPQFNQRSEEEGFAQQDAEECYSLLLASIQQALKQESGPSEPVASLLTGKLTSTLTCDEDPELAPVITTDAFIKLDCHVLQATSHLMSGLTEALATSLDMNHPTLGRPARFCKKSQISALPPYLTIHFIRFFWKKAEKLKAKILKRVSFPMQLDVYPLCTSNYQETTLKDARDKMAAAAISHEPQHARQMPELDVLPKPSGYYELVGVLTHAGRSADGGHYVGWARDEQKHELWWKYDDETVSQVKEEDILRLDGGGDWHTAYMLFYRAKEHL